MRSEDECWRGHFRLKSLTVPPLWSGHRARREGWEKKKHCSEHVGARCAPLKRWARDGAVPCLGVEWGRVAFSGRLGHTSSSQGGVSICPVRSSELRNAGSWETVRSASRGGVFWGEESGGPGSAVLLAFVLSFL